jgi:hypothetical protein
MKNHKVDGDYNLYKSVLLRDSIFVAYFASDGEDIAEKELILSNISKGCKSVFIKNS